MKTKKLLAAACLTLAICEVSAQAQTFTYNPGDLLVAFGSTNSGSANNVIVDLGAYSSFTQGAQTSVANVSSALTTAFGGTSGVYWSAFSYTGQTLLLSDPRTPYYLANDPTSVNSLTASAQGQVTTKLQAIINGATSPSATILANQIVELPSTLNVGGNPVSYTIGVGSLGDFNGTWQWDTRNFMDGVNPATSDLFLMRPGPANTALDYGYVSVNANGTMIVAAPEPSTWALFGGGLASLMLFRRKSVIN
jgi:hypothetical protein